MCPLSGRESGGARPCDATISRQPYRHRITTASSRIRPELASPAGLTATCAGLHAVGGRCAGSDCIDDQATWPAYLYIATTRGNARSCADRVSAQGGVRLASAVSLERETQLPTVSDCPDCRRTGSGLLEVAFRPQWRSRFRWKYARTLRVEARPARSWCRQSQRPGRWCRGVRELTVIRGQVVEAGRSC
jgi:hypothetical protein